jgi:hypothetical protein
MAVLRYIGVQPANFKDTVLYRRPGPDEPPVPPIIARVGELQPLQEFSVPDELAERYMRREDIEVVVAPAAPAAPAVEDAQPQDAQPQDAAEPTDAAAQEAQPQDGAPLEDAQPQDDKPPTRARSPRSKQAPAA